MLLPTIVMAACAIPLALGPERRCSRAWGALALPVAAMAAGAVIATPGAYLCGGVLALLSAPIAVAGAPRGAGLAGLHRAIAALLTAWCLFSGAAGHTPAANGPAHHMVTPLGPLLAGLYGLIAVIAVAHHWRRREGRFAACGEVAGMSAGVAIMLLPA
ncbi:hypothetical protein [Agromyces silvae]|uniref:hypothetical protein n=1 Tax=Agromyces silvae TaxID=3388266 RepID=UPI00280A9FC8|nr:hypothetical protein [Agromyces protaetiae]